MNTMYSTPNGPVCTGTWNCERHSVTFTVLDNGKVSITESFKGNFWNKFGTSRISTLHMKVEIDEAAIEQDKYIRLGYRKLT